MKILDQFIRLIIIINLALLSNGNAEEIDRCYNVSGLFEDSVLTELTSTTFEDIIKIKECKKLDTKTQNQMDEEPPDAIKVPPRMIGRPLNVEINFYIEDISHIDEEEMQFRIDYYLLQSWTAQRIYCNNYRKFFKTLDIDLLMFNDSGDMLTMNSDFLKYFWTPDTFIVNAKHVSVQSNHPATKSLLLYVDENTFENGGDDTGAKICHLKLSGRFTATIPCAMNFRFYPVDVQNCQFHFRSFSFPVDEMILKWKEAPVLRQLQLPQHNSKLTSSNGTYVNILNSKQYHERNYSLDDIPDEQKFSLLTVNIRLSRDISNKIAGVYIPTALIVTVCFTTFWFGSKSISDRVTVGVTALLAFITQFIETRKFIPPISYVTLLEIWMLMCMVFVFIQLIEGTIVHYYYLKGKHQIRLRRKNIKRSLKIFEQDIDHNETKLSKFVTTAESLHKSIGKWRKDREPVKYNEPPAELLINRFKYANHVYRREKFSTKNQVHFDSNLTYLPAINQSDTNQKQTDLNQINYSLESPVPALKNKLAQQQSNDSRFYSTSQLDQSNLLTKISNIDFRSTLSGAEIRNLDLLQLLNDQNVRDWLTETIYPDHVNFGLISVLKHYWRILFSVDLPNSSPHYYSLKVDKYARVFIPLLYLICLCVYMIIIIKYMELDNKTELENEFAYKILK